MRVQTSIKLYNGKEVTQFLKPRVIWQKYRKFFKSLNGKEYRKVFKSSRKNGKDYSKVVKMAQSTAKQVTLGMAGLAITAKF